MKAKALWSIIYQNEHLIAVNKASGIAVAGDRWTPAKERLDKLLAESLEIAKLFIVHRIDSGTSGVVLFAKDAETHAELCAAFEKREVLKRYIVIVHGNPPWDAVTCELPLVPDATKNHAAVVDKFRGKKALTHFEVLTRANGIAALAARPETGRQHQIRVHCAALGFPVVCDELYGSAKPVYLSRIKPSYRGSRSEERPLLARLGLHAEYLALARLSLEFCAPLPGDIKALMHQIKKCEH